jgi:hypothetical protein
MMEAPPANVEWEVYEAIDGRNYETRGMAELVARNLTLS